MLFSFSLKSSILLIFFFHGIVFSILLVIKGFYSMAMFLYDQIISGDIYFYSDGKDKDFSSWYQVAGFLSLSYYLILCLKDYYTYKAITFGEGGMYSFGFFNRREC